jgi:hypothetical protein
MKNNAIKFNGTQNQIAEEAVEIHKFVKDQIEASRSEFTPLEQEVEELMSGKTYKQAKANAKKAKGVKGKKSLGTISAAGTSSTAASGLADSINLDDIEQAMLDDDDDDDDTDTDDESIGDFDL